MIKGETVLSGGKHPGTELEVLGKCDRGGFYLGFRDKEGHPYSRETLYMTRTAAEEMLLILRS